jgi:hypothetical protein
MALRNGETGLRLNILHVTGDFLDEEGVYVEFAVLNLQFAGGKTEISPCLPTANCPLQIGYCEVVAAN